MRARLRGLNDETTQKVLATITFDFKIYVLTGWKGSAYDSQVLNDTFSRSVILDIAEGIIGSI